MSSEIAISLTLHACAFTVALQSVELLSMHQEFDDERGVWRWSSLRADYRRTPALMQRLLDLLFDHRGFVLLLSLRAAAALALPWYPTATLCAWLALSTMLIGVRFRGTFQGGSDAMTMILLLALFVAYAGATRAYAHGALLFIAVESVLSYFVAGLVKLRNPEWRSGAALAAFIAHRRYEAPRWARVLAAKPQLTWVAAWLVMTFECGFPLVFRSGVPWTYPFLGVGLLLHLANVLVFRLTRFFWAWLSTYPAVLYAADQLSRM